MTNADHVSGDTINIQIESYDDTVPVHGTDPAPYPAYPGSPSFSEFIYGSDEEGRWTSGSSGPSSPAAHAQTIACGKDTQIAHLANVHVRNDSNSSLNINHLSPPPVRLSAVDTSFNDYRSTAQDPIFSPEDTFVGHEFPDPSADDADTLLFGSTIYSNFQSDTQQLPSPIESQLDLSSIGLQSAPVPATTADTFLQVPTRPNRPRSNTHEGTVHTVAPRDVFQPAHLSPTFSTAELEAIYGNQPHSPNDSAIADDYLPSPHSPVGSMKSSSSTLFGALEEPFTSPVNRNDARRRKSDTGVMTKPSIHQLQTQLYGEARFQPTTAAPSQFTSIPITQQQGYQTLQVYHQPSFSKAVIPDMSLINQRQGNLSINTPAARGRGIARSTPSSRRHSPYPQANILPSPTSEHDSYHDPTTVVIDPSNHVDFIKPEDEDLPLTHTPPVLGRYRTVPGGNPNHVPLTLNATVRRSPSNPNRGKYDSLGMQPHTTIASSSQGSHARHVSLNDQPFLHPSVKTEFMIPSLQPPMSLGIQRQTITSDATREAARKRRTKDPKFFCDCGENFTARHNYERHLQAHEGRRPFLCACGTAFTSKSDRKRHIDKSKRDECKAPPIDV